MKSEDHSSEEPRFSMRVSLALQYAREEALRFNHDYLGTEHILLSLIQLGVNGDFDFWVSLGCDFDKMREAIEKTFKVRKGLPKLGAIPFTEQAENALRTSYAESKLHGSSDIETEHLLLALLKEEDSLVATVLKSFNVTYEAVSSRLRNQEQQLNPIISIEDIQRLLVEFPLSKHVWDILKTSQIESQKNMSAIIHSEHLLSATLKLKDSTAGKMLTYLGITEAKLKQALEAVRKNPADPL